MTTRAQRHAAALRDLEHKPLLDKWHDLLAACRTISTWTTAVELAWLADQASTRTRILEIGTYEGASAKVLAAAAPAAIIHCIDHFNAAHDTWDKANRNLATEIASGQVVLHRGEANVSLLKLVHEAVCFDMIWIDDGHERGDLQRDVTAALLLSAPNALICGHDYANGNAVALGVHDCLEDQVGFGPGSIWYKLCPNLI